MLSTIIQIVGACLLAFGVGMLSIPFGFIAAGLLVLAFGVAAERRS